MAERRMHYHMLAATVIYLDYDDKTKELLKVNTDHSLYTLCFSKIILTIHVVLQS